MSGRYTISQLAHAAGVPATTVRYYERIGLVEPDDRSAGNYRLYGDESLRKLQFIRAAQGTGFTLEDVKTLLGIRDRGAASCRDVQALVEERLADIEARLRDLRHVRKVLKASLDTCRQRERDGCCHVMETLQSAT